jgi:regulator of protease activity HflC (stomatin/prohibitin superfamily)
MKNTIMNKMLLIPILILGFLAGCTTIPPGSVGILVNKYGSNRGVQDYTTTTGYVTYNPVSTSVIEYPTSVQTYAWTANPSEGEEGHPPDESITFTTKDSVSINADISLSYLLDAQKIPSFYVKFRSDDLSNFTFGFLHNVTRDAMMEIGGRYTVEEIMGNNEPFLHAVRERIQSQVADIGVNLQQFGFIGSPRPPAQVVNAINAAQQAKYAAIQTQNELAQTQAEVAKQIAAAHGVAESNQIIANSITENLLKKQQLDIQDRWIVRWDGHRPSVESGTGTGFLFTLPAGSK